jgi:hypothetical protein
MSERSEAQRELNRVLLAPSPYPPKEPVALGRLEALRAAICESGGPSS